MISTLTGNPLLLLFMIAAIGYALGQIRVGGFSLGIAAVLFVGLGFGAIDPAIKLPDFIDQFGLVLFIYTIGLSSGPGFASSLRGRGLKNNMLALGVLTFGAALAIAFHYLLGFKSAVSSGLFNGAFTNTVALASVVGTIKEIYGASSDQMAAASVSAYSVSYPFGVIGTMIVVYIGSRVFRVDYAAEAKSLNDPAAGSQDIVNRTILVTRADTGGLSLLAQRRAHRWRVIFGRHKRNEQVRLIDAETTVQPGDLFTVIGSDEETRAVLDYFGEPGGEALELDHRVLQFKRIFVSNPEVVEKPLSELHLPEKLGCIITRVRRGDVELLPDRNTVLELGDRVRVVAPKERFGEIRRHMGDSYKAVSEVDVIPMALGIVLGIIIGSISIPLPGFGKTGFSFGLAGGALMSGLFLGWLGRTGPIIWQMPYSANLTLRQIGLVMFLAGVGVRSGFSFINTIMHGNGLSLFLAGAGMTTLAMIVALWVGYRFLKIPMGVVVGVVAGVQTSSALLAFANEQSKTNLSSIGYASTYPVATVAKIILAQIILLAGSGS